MLAIKASENFKVAFAGLIKNRKVTLEEATQIFEDEYPTSNGIWIEEKCRNAILDYLNQNLKSKYEIDKNGYLKIIVRDHNEYVDTLIINMLDLFKELEKKQLEI